MIQKVDPFKFSERSKWKIDILDYAYSDFEFQSLYQKDSRVEKYHKAKLIYYRKQKNWTLAGHYSEPHLRGTRPNCGQIRGVKVAKIVGSKPKPIINSCGKLQCKICFREASAIKSQNIMDHIESVLYRMMFDKVKFSRNKDMNIQFKHYSFNLAPREPSVRDWSHLLDFGINYSSFKDNLLKPVREIVNKYFLGAVIIYHPRRFMDQERREFLYFSPHFHVIGIGYLPKLQNFERRHGFNYTQFSHKDEKTGNTLYYLPRKQDIRNVLKYALSHCGLYTYQQKRLKRETEQERSEGAERITTEITAVHPAYFYTGLFSPQYWKVASERKYKVAELDDKDNPYYELLEGFVLKAESANGLTKILTPREVYQDRPISFFIDSDASICIFWDSVKFGNRLKIEKRLKVLLRIKIYRQLKNLNLQFFKRKSHFENFLE